MIKSQYIIVAVFLTVTVHTAGISVFFSVRDPSTDNYLIKCYNTENNQTITSFELPADFKDIAGRNNDSIIITGVRYGCDESYDYIEKSLVLNPNTGDIKEYKDIIISDISIKRGTYIGTHDNWMVRYFENTKKGIEGGMFGFSPEHAVIVEKEIKTGAMKTINVDHVLKPIYTGQGNIVYKDMEDLTRLNTISTTGDKLGSILVSGDYLDKIPPDDELILEKSNIKRPKRIVDFAIFEGYIIVATYYYLLGYPFSESTEGTFEIGLPSIWLEVKTPIRGIDVDKNGNVVLLQDSYMFDGNRQIYIYNRYTGNGEVIYDIPDTLFPPFAVLP